MLHVPGTAARCCCPLLLLLLTSLPCQNFELALGWYTSERKVQDNATLSEQLLIKAPNGTVLYDSPGPTMLQVRAAADAASGGGAGRAGAAGGGAADPPRQAFWDYRAPAVLDYWKERILSQVHKDPSCRIPAVNALRDLCCSFCRR